MRLQSFMEDSKLTHLIRFGAKKADDVVSMIKMR
jgi:hypothetical protein